MAFDPYSRVKNVPRKKYLYQYTVEEEAFEEDLIQDFETEFEQPKGRRQSRRQAHSKRKRHVSDFY